MKSVTKTQLGSRYENQAREFFESKNYEIIGQNIRFRCGEIDLIALEISGSKKTLVFIEVRKRDSRSLDTPEESITTAKRRRLFNAIDVYLNQWRGRADELRIDLVAFHNEELRHHKNFMVRGY